MKYELTKEDRKELADKLKREEEWNRQRINAVMKEIDDDEAEALAKLRACAIRRAFVEAAKVSIVGRTLCRPTVNSERRVTWTKKLSSNS